MEQSYTNITGNNLYFLDNKTFTAINSSAIIHASNHGNYNSIIFISFFCSFVIVITVGYTFWQWSILQSMISSSKYDSHASHLSIFPTTLEKSVSDSTEKEENTHLLSNSGLTLENDIENVKMKTSQQTKISDKTHQTKISDKNQQTKISDKTQHTKISDKTLKNALKRSRYFRGNCLKDGNDTMLMLAFTSVVSMGILIVLHTTQGPRHVLLTMVGDEVRWQSIKQTNNKIKRYKLNLEDVMFVEIGKQLGHFQNVEEGSALDCDSGILCDDHDTSTQFDHLCFSLVTKKSSLHLEAASKLDRDSLVRGFQLRLESTRS
jgi:hypothetical protein